jgi:hypothetical protein
VPAFYFKNIVRDPIAGPYKLTKRALVSKTDRTMADSISGEDEKSL